MSPPTSDGLPHLTEEEQKRARWHRKDGDFPDLCRSNCGEGWPCFMYRTLRELSEARGLAEGLAGRLREAMQRKMVLDGMTQEQKAAIFDIKALVGDGLRHYGAYLKERGSHEPTYGAA